MTQKDVNDSSTPGSFELREDAASKCLNDLLRHEIAAAAMYEKAAKKVKGEERIAFEQNRWSHVVSAVALGQMIRDHGAAPASGAGRWQLASSLVAGSAVLSQGLALRALHETEHRISEAMEHRLDDLPYRDRERVEADILPLQRECEQRARSILVAA